MSEVSERPLQVSVHDGELRVGYDFAGIEGLVDRAKGLRDKDRAVVRVTVPASVPLKVTTARAAATVVGTRADVSVTTGTGAVRVQGVSGTASVRTATGSVDVGEHVGDVHVTTASGTVTLGGTLGRVSVSTVTSGGEVVARESTPLVDARTVSGDVAVRLGAGSAVNLKARSVTGKAVLDGVRLDSSAQRTTSVDHVDQHGAGGAYVSASTVSGDLTVSRG